MPFFSRLTDIVTCNLTSILNRVDDKQKALEEIIFEMKEGLAGAERSVKTAGENVSQIEIEIGEQRQQIDQWLQSAQSALATGDESRARHALARKHEVEDLIAGLEHQLTAATSTRDHLKTIQNAMQARLADAQRRLKSVADGGDYVISDGETDPPTESIAALERQSRVDAELEVLRRQIESR